MHIIYTEDGDRIRSENIEYCQENDKSRFDGVRRFYRFYNCTLQKMDEIDLIDVKDIRL